MPKPAGQTYFHKYGLRQANAPAIVTVAINVAQQNGRITAAAIALGGADQTAARAGAAESVLIGAELNEASIAAAAEAAAAASNPITDAVASEWYRRKMVAVQLKRGLTALAAGGN